MDEYSCMSTPRVKIRSFVLFNLHKYDLSIGLFSNPILSADNTSLFPFVHYIDSSTNLKYDLKKISQCTFQWKMSFNANPIKQTPKVFFSRKLKRPTHPPLKFKGSFVNQTNFENHLLLGLNSKLNFKEHLQTLCKKVPKQLQFFAYSKVFYLYFHYVLYTSFIRPQLDYEDIIFVQSYYETFHKKRKSIKHNASLAIIGPIRRTSRENFYQELNLESIKDLYILQDF